MFKVGDTVIYNMDAPNQKLRGKEGTITKIQDGKKTVKFKGIGEPVIVKAANMTVVDLKQEVGAPKAAVQAPAADGLYKKGDKVIYYFEKAPGRYGDAKWNDLKGTITVDQVAGNDWVTAQFPGINPEPIDWYLYNVRRDGAAAVAPAPPPPPAPRPVLIPEVVVEAPAAAVKQAVERDLEDANHLAVYKAGQRICGLKLGDTVKIIRKAQKGDGGWNIPWNGRMDDYVGQEKKIENVHPEFGFKCQGYWFPWFVLEKVLVAPPQEKVFQLDGVDFKVTKNGVRIGGRLAFDADALINALALAHAEVKGVQAA